MGRGKEERGRAKALPSFFVPATIYHRELVGLLLRYIVEGLMIPDLKVS